MGTDRDIAINEDGVRVLNTLREYLEWRQESFQILGAKMSTHQLKHRDKTFVFYKGMDDILLRKGMEYQKAARPKGMKQGLPKHCFWNVLKYLKLKTKGYIYVEGYVVIKQIPIPIHHAWLTTVKNPTVAYDPTLDYEPHEVEYLGIPFKTDYVIDINRRSGNKYASVLDAWWTNFELYSKSKEEIDELIDARGMKIVAAPVDNHTETCDDEVVSA